MTDDTTDNKNDLVTMTQNNLIKSPERTFSVHQEVRTFNVDADIRLFSVYDT